MSIFAKQKPTAKVLEGRLILSMPDAETPAVWVLDLADALTTVLRLEFDNKQNLYVIKKHGAKAPAETIAVYRNRTRALNALNTVSRTLDKARSANDNGSTKSSNLQRNLIIILFIWFALFRFGQFDSFLIDLAFNNSANYNTARNAEYDAQIAEIMSKMSAEELGISKPVAPEAKSAPVSPERAGVPLSADDFLRHRAENPPFNDLY